MFKALNDDNVFWYSLWSTLFGIFAIILYFNDITNTQLKLQEKVVQVQRMEQYSKCVESMKQHAALEIKHVCGGAF